MERVWGGRRLESLYGKTLPPGKTIGESWEIVDREEAQSVVRQGPWVGKTLHELWINQRAEIFGAAVPESDRFPILAKLLDARAKLSLQVHPPATVAASLGGESKNEWWYFAEAEEGAAVFAGLHDGVDARQFQCALDEGVVADLVPRLRVRTGDSFYVPSGRLHAIGEGNLIVEIQQNSDTTYRVFDWNRQDGSGQPRKLHRAESMRAIDFQDYEPEIVRPEGEQLLVSSHFQVESWQLAGPRRASETEAFAIFVCLEGAAQCGELEAGPGQFFLVPAAGAANELKPLAQETRLLRITL